MSLSEKTSMALLIEQHGKIIGVLTDHSKMIDSLTGAIETEKEYVELLQRKVDLLTEKVNILEKMLEVSNET